MNTIKKRTGLLCLLFIFLFTFTVKAEPVVYIPVDRNIPNGTKLVVQANNLKFRSAENINLIIGTLKRNDIVYLVEYGDEYAKVRTADNTEGFCAVDYLLAEVAATVTPTSTALPTQPSGTTQAVTDTQDSTEEPIATKSDPSETLNTFGANVSPVVYNDTDCTRADKLSRIPTWVYLEMAAAAVVLLIFAAIKVLTR